MQSEHRDFKESFTDSQIEKPRNYFTSVKNGRIVLYRRVHVERALERIIEKFKQNIRDLFLIVPAPKTKLDAFEEGEDTVDTKYGQLRVFFVNGLHRAKILHTSRFNYPKISRPKV